MYVEGAMSVCQVQAFIQFPGVPPRSPRPAYRLTAPVQQRVADRQRVAGVVWHGDGAAMQNAVGRPAMPAPVGAAALREASENPPSHPLAAAAEEEEEEYEAFVLVGATGLAPAREAAVGLPQRQLAWLSRDLGSWEMNCGALELPMRPQPGCSTWMASLPEDGAPRAIGPGPRA
jgi:hypothetical protein